MEKVLRVVLRVSRKVEEKRNRLLVVVLYNNILKKKNIIFYDDVNPISLLFKRMML